MYAQVSLSRELERAWPAVRELRGVGSGEGSRRRGWLTEREGRVSGVREDGRGASSLASSLSSSSHRAGVD